MTPLKYVAMSSHWIHVITVGLGLMCVFTTSLQEPAIPSFFLGAHSTSMELCFVGSVDSLLCMVFVSIDPSVKFF